MRKYHNEPVIVDGIRFDSKKEAARWKDLCLLQQAGLIRSLKRQVKFELLPKNGDERSLTYIADFTYQEDGKNIVEDVKSDATKRDKVYIIKRKMLKWRYSDINFRET
jgi:hypothetical protein